MKKLFERQTSYYPNYYPQATEFIHSLWSNTWSHLEFDWSSDTLQYHNSLTPIERCVIKRALLAISQIEVSVKTFWAKLGEHLPQPVFSDLGFVMAGNEVVHARAYSNLLLLLGLEDEFQKLMDDDTSVLRQRHFDLDACARFGINSLSKPEHYFFHKLLMFTICTEWTSLFSQFYILSHFHRFKGYLPKVNQQLAYTIQEEQLHAEVGFWLLNLLYEQYPNGFDDDDCKRFTRVAVNRIIQSERKMIDWILEGYDNPNLTGDIVYHYILDRFNKALDRIDAKFLDAYTTDEQLLKMSKWMADDTEGLHITDFFHKRPIGYSKAVDWSDW